MWKSRLLYLTGCLISGLTLLQVIPFLFAYLGDETGSVEAFGASIFFSALIGGSLYLGFRGVPQMRTPSLTITLPVAAISASAFVIGLPFFFVFPERGFITALYEGVAMITTSGASAYLGSLDIYPSLIIWQAASAWIGGLMAITYALSLLTALNIGGIQLHQTSLPYGRSDTGYPRLVSTAKALIGIYALMTALCCLLLILGGYAVFDAVILSATLLSTTGLTSHNGGVIPGGFGQFVAVIFLLISMMNWDFIYTRLKTQKLDASDRFELRAAFFIIALAAAAMAALFDAPFLAALWDAAFLAVSVMSTTGYLGGEALWSDENGNAIAIICLGLLVAGGAAASTTGGLKLMRLGALFTVIRSEISRLAHPNSIRHIRYNEVPIQRSDYEALWLAISGFIATIVVGCLLLSIVGFSFINSVGLTVSALTLSGPAVFTIDSHFFGFSGLSQIDYGILAVLMVCGRVEVPVIFALFAKAVWRR